MKNTTAFLMKKYQSMSGEQKVRISLSLSNMVNTIYQEGKVAREHHYGNRPSKSSH